MEGIKFHFDFLIFQQRITPAVDTLDAILLNSEKK